MSDDTSLNLGLLKSLCESAGIPGREDAIRDIVVAEMRGLVDDVSVDALGNVVGVRKGTGGPRVMLMAHMDEIGFIVRHIDDKGFIRVHPAGGFDPRVLPAQRVLVHGYAGEPLLGVLTTAAKPIHLLSPGEIKPPTVEELYVDVGLAADEVRARVEIGDMVTMQRTVEMIGNNVMGKAFDDRICVFQMLEALRKLDGPVAAEIIAVATTQEEVGLRGATTSSYHVDPDIGIALDVTLARDIPDTKDQDTVTKLGAGVAIKIMDTASISNYRLVRHMREVAHAAGIDYQLEILPRGGTDAGAVQRTRGGVAAITMSIPTRYVHTVNEMCSRSDIQAAIDLLAEYLRHAHEGVYGYDASQA